MAYASSATYLIAGRHLVAVTHRSNDHMQIYIIIKWNGLMVDRLTGPTLMSL